MTYTGDAQICETTTY